MACDLANLRLPEFTSGFRLGLAALLAGGIAWAVLGLRGRQGRLGPLPIGGLLFTLASLEGLRETGHLVTGCVAGAALLGLGGLAASGRDYGLLWRGVLAAPGTVVLMAGAGLVNPGWSRAVVGVLVFLAAISLHGFERRCRAHDLNPGMVMLAVTVVGLYETVPDPDLALVLLGAALPLLFLGWPFPAASLGGAGWAAFGLVGWEAGVGGSGRLSAVIGGVGCLGLFLVEPLATALRGNKVSVLELLPPRAGGGLVLGLAQLAVVYVASRIAGANPRHDATVAVLIVAADLALWALGFSWLAGPSRRRDRFGPGTSESSSTDRSGIPDSQ